MPLKKIALAVAAIILITAPWYARQAIKYHSQPVLIEPGTHPRALPPACTRAQGQRPPFFGIAVNDILNRPVPPVLHERGALGDVHGDLGRLDRKLRVVLLQRRPVAKALPVLQDQSKIGVLPTLLAIAGWLGLVALVAVRRVERIPFLPVVLLPLLAVDGLPRPGLRQHDADGDLFKASYILTTAPVWALTFGLAFSWFARWRLLALASPSCSSSAACSSCGSCSTGSATIRDLLDGRSHERCACRWLPSWEGSRSSSRLPPTSTRAISTRYLGYDEGNYLGSLDALRHGQALGRDVFLDQPPGWYLLLVAVSYPFGNSVSGVRTGLVVVSLLAIVAAYACGRLAGGPLAGVVAAAVMGVARPFPGVAGLVESEPASAALAVVAVALAVGAYRARFRPWLAFAAGVALAAATAVKLPGATAGLPIAALALLCGNGPVVRRLLPPVAGAAAVCVALVVSYRNALPQIWHGVVVAHTRILGTGTAQSNTHRALTFVDPRTPFGCLVIAGAARLRRRRGAGALATAARGALDCGPSAATDSSSRCIPLAGPPFRLPRRRARAAGGRRARPARRRDCLVVPRRPPRSPSRRSSPRASTSSGTRSSTA